MSGQGRTDVLHVAAVYAHDGTRLLTASHSAKIVSQRVAACVASQAEILLWPADAHRVRALLEIGRTEEAIAWYFARVGQRWEREYLHREAVDAGRSTSAWSEA
jgi:hypothetical protein